MDCLRGPHINFYKHHLGDYDGATAHLSWDEDMAYTRLLRTYYRREEPFIDMAEAYRLTRAVSKAQKAAITSVLAEFFEQRDDGWHNKRADEEIEKYLVEGEDGAAKKENERERQKRYRERRKVIFAELREHGIVPKWDTPIEELETLLSRVQKRNGDAPVTRTATANQEPVPSTQEPNTSLRASRSPDGVKILMEIGVAEQHAKDWLAVRKAKRAPLTDTVIQNLQAQASKAGISVAQAVEICAKKCWQGFNADWEWKDAGVKAPGTDACGKCGGSLFAGHVFTQEHGRTCNDCYHERAA